MRNICLFYVAGSALYIYVLFYRYFSSDSHLFSYCSLMILTSIHLLTIVRSLAHKTHKQTATRLYVHPTHRLRCDEGVMIAAPSFSRRRPAAAAAAAGVARCAGARRTGAPRPPVSSSAGSTDCTLPFLHPARPSVSDNHTHRYFPCTQAAMSACSSVHSHVLRAHYSFSELKWLE